MDAEVTRALQSFKTASLDERVAALVEDAGTRTADAADLVGRLGVTQDQIASALERLAEDHVVRLLQEGPAIAVSNAVFDAAGKALRAEVAKFHDAEPLARGIAREDLRGRALRGASPLLFRALLDHLASARQLALEQDIVRLYDRTVTLGEEDARIRSRLEERYRALGLQAPAADELIRELGLERTRARRILKLMVDDRILGKVSEDTFVDAAALASLIERVRGLKQASPRFGVKEFKDLTGLSRKFAMPLLEYLDAQRVTRRMGDERVIL
jgi:selenocysteine-specific elongation factor